MSSIHSDPKITSLTSEQIESDIKIYNESEQILIRKLKGAVGSSGLMEAIKAQWEEIPCELISPMTTEHWKKGFLGALYDICLIPSPTMREQLESLNSDNPLCFNFAIFMKFKRFNFDHTVMEAFGRLTKSLRDVEFKDLIAQLNQVLDPKVFAVASPSTVLFPMAGAGVEPFSGAASPY